MRSVGINYCNYYGLSPEQFAKEIKALGFGATFTESSDAGFAEKCAKAFYENKIAWETIHAPFDGINNIWLDSDDGNAILRKMKTTIDICADFSVPTAIIHLSSGEKAPSISDIGKTRFAELVDYSVSKNINLAFENQRKLANIAWAFEEFEDYENVGFCWDVGHEGCFAGGREYMPLFGKRLICTHIHDNDLKQNHDLHMIPFDGRIDFYKVAKQIKANGFAGTLMLELMIDNSDYYVNSSPRAYIERAAFAAKRLRDMIDN